MKKIFLIANLLLLFPFPLFSLEDKAVLPDSLMNIDCVFSITDLKQAQQILDELWIHKQNPEWQFNWCQAELYSNAGKHRLSSYFFEKTAQFEEVKENAKLYMSLMSSMIESYLASNDIEEAMARAIELRNTADSLKNIAEMGRSYLFMGRVMYQQKKMERAEEYFELSKKYLEKSENTKYLYEFNLTLANLLNEQKKQTQAYERVIDANALLERVQSLDDWSFTEEIASRERGKLYAIAAEVLSESENLDMAQTYYNHFNQTLCATDNQYNILIVPYLLQVKNYIEAIKISNEHIEMLKTKRAESTQEMMLPLSYLIESYRQRGELDKALFYAKEAIITSNAIREKENSSILEELAIIHEMQLKETQSIKKEKELEIRNNLLIGSSIIVLLLIVIVVLVLYTVKRVKNKNLAIIRQIRMLELYKKDQQNDIDSFMPADLYIEGDLNSYYDEQTRIKKIFLAIDKLIRKEKLYLNPNFTRDDLTELLSVKRSDIIQAVNEFSGSSFTDYINKFRIIESLILLETAGHDTIEQIAEFAGFGSTRSFYRQFKKKYNISPSQYRKLISKD